MKKTGSRETAGDSGGRRRLEVITNEAKKAGRTERGAELSGDV